MIDVVYDGRCGFCVRSLRIVRRLARREVFRVTARFPVLAGADTDEVMFAITPEGDVFRGFFAFKRMMRASPWRAPYRPLFGAPGASVVSPKIYAWIARHRRSFGCTGTVCDRPESAGSSPPPA